MNEIKKFTNEEIEEVRKIQQKYQDVVNLFGQLYISRLEIEEGFRILSEKEKTAQKELGDVQTSSDVWVKKIIDKYGEGNLNIQDGTFTPSSQTPK